MEYKNKDNNEEMRHDILKKLDNDLNEENHLLNPGNSFEHMYNPISYKVIQNMQKPPVETKNPKIDIDSKE